MTSENFMGTFINITIVCRLKDWFCKYNLENAFCAFPEAVRKLNGDDNLNVLKCAITRSNGKLFSIQQTRWRHQMETFSALLVICTGNSPVPGEFPTQRPVTQSFDVFFVLRLNKRLSKQSWGWWLETLSRPLWGHCNGVMTKGMQSNDSPIYLQKTDHSSQRVCSAEKYFHVMTSSWYKSLPTNIRLIQIRNPLTMHVLHCVIIVLNERLRGHHMCNSW